MIKAENLCKKFERNVKKGRRSVKEEFLAVDHVSLEARPGEIVGVLGPNGAGKTTLLRMLGMLMTPTAGSVRMSRADGSEIEELTQKKAAIGYLSGNTKLYPRFSIREYLKFLGELYGFDKETIRERTEEIFRVLAMESFGDNRIEKLSTGQMQRASIARCLMADPAFYILDEPTLGLDILSADAIIHFMQEQKSRGKTVLYSTHYLEEAEFLCDRLYMLCEGKIMAEDFLHPVTFEAEDQASDSESFGMNIGGSIGMMLVVTILLGAMYPAIDATAGEKERGTLETLLTLPVTNFQMILSKYISVSLFACVTAIISLLSLGGSVLFLIFGVAGEILKDMPHISPVVLAAVVPGLLLTMISTALLVTAACMCFCVFARSFKEANNYVTPLLFVVMFASMAGMLPMAEFDYVTAMIPFVNVSLMIRQAAAWQFEPPLVGITILVNLGYSILAVYVLARIYNSENVLFSDGFAGFKLFQKRSEIKKGTIPAPGDLLVSVTVLLLLLLYAGSAVSVRFGFWGTMVSQLLIFAVPLFMVWYLKSDVRTLFSLRRPRRGTLAGSVLLFLGAYSLMICAGSVLMELLPGSAENLGISFEPVLEQPFPVILLVVAAMPAVGEEILFRGFLFGSLRARVSVPKAVLISAAVFAAFHMSLVKLIPTFMLGAAFACILSETGSLYVTSFLHFLNNAVSMAVSKYPEQAAKLMPFLVKEKLEVPELLFLLAVGSVLTLAGAGLFRVRSRGVR